MLEGKISNQMHTITTDNASVNSKIGHQIEDQLTNFDSSHNLLGCLISGQDWNIKTGTIHKNEDESHLFVSNPMDINFVTDLPNGAQIDSKPILKHIHGFCTWVCFSPQLFDQKKDCLR
ncbi:hypothetical protein VP01_1029g1 [Puccinia sorghi]|uniref:Uncharacterized protein n=1 Tax=Puccinia sorghi TaxID=27349 RepID=A0A0L6VW08_9BASI|nr:hypothetical protein VP01_1029g1 [Puccinia sorghi]